jgi:hypothetical protein
LFLIFINQISIHFAPCNYLHDSYTQEHSKNNITYYECSFQDGIIVQGGFLLSKISPEWFIALFTLTLWVATVGLWWTAQEHARHLERSVKIAEKTAIAATRSAEHLPRVERAYLSGGGDATPDRTRFRFDVNNYGKTPGEILQICWGTCTADNIPSAPPAVYPSNIHFRDWIEPGRRSRNLSAHTRYPPIPTGDDVFYGRYFYRDIFGQVYSVGFIYRLDVNGAPMAIEANPGYGDERYECEYETWRADGTRSLPTPYSP